MEHFTFKLQNFWVYAESFLQHCRSGNNYNMQAMSKWELAYYFLMNEQKEKDLAMQKKSIESLHFLENHDCFKRNNLIEIERVFKTFCI